MFENQVKKKKVVVKPLVGNQREKTVEVPENMSVGEAITQAFPKVKGKRIVVQDNKDKPISLDTKASTVDEVRVTPFTEGG